MEVVIAIICGNDFWRGNQNIQEIDGATKLNLQRFCDGMLGRARNVFAIVGGSAALWGYDAWMNLSMQEQFDTNAKIFQEIVSARGINCVSGVRELEGIRVADWIGHVNVDSKHIVVNAFRQWLNIAVSPPSPSAMEQINADTHISCEIADFVAPPPPIAQATKCKHSNCWKNGVRAGWCKRHFWETPEGKVGWCKHVDCPKAAVWDGWCRAHYWEVNPVIVCDTEFCNKNPFQNGFCKVCVGIREKAKAIEREEQEEQNQLRLEEERVALEAIGADILATVFFNMRCERESRMQVMQRIRKNAVQQRRNQMSTHVRQDCNNLHGFDHEVDGGTVDNRHLHSLCNEADDEMEDGIGFESVENRSGDYLEHHWIDSVTSASCERDFDQSTYWEDAMEAWGAAATDLAAEVDQ